MVPFMAVIACIAAQADSVAALICVMSNLKVFPFLLASVLLAVMSASAATNGISPERVQQIAAMISPGPASFGEPISNREAWAKAAANPSMDAIVGRAEKLAAEPIPEMTDDLYLDCSITGNRDRGQKVDFARTSRLSILTLAECIENRGRFLEPLQRTIEAICAERAWTYPAHDLNLEVFHGHAMRPDLRATTLAFDLATADYLLGDKLPKATRQLLRENIRKRVLLPFRGTVEGKLKDAYWLHITNNWNAVCLAGTLGAALAIEPSPEERAWYVAAAEKYIHSFLSGFAKDGYCYEGVGYWNYGFGHFIVLTEEIRKATGGRVDLFQLPEVEMPAQFADRDEIVNGVYPSISDVNPGQKPDTQWTRYVNERFQIAPKPGVQYKNSVGTGNLAEAAFGLFAEKPWPVAKVIAHGNDSPLRTWFNEGGVLIARPGADEPEAFAVVLKGGSNGESHNHNDVGSFSVVLGRAMIICDPGAEVYTRRTFGSHRYDSDVLNSFGHAVPIVAGQLQATGSSARAVVLRSDFTDAGDVLAFDLRSAYPVPDLKKMERTFDYRRGADAGLRVEDEVVFEKPEQFESALITWGEWQEVAKNEFAMSDGGEELRVNVDTGGVPYTIRKTMLNADVHTPKQPWHIGIVLDRAVKEAKVTLNIRPIFRKD